MIWLLMRTNPQHQQVLLYFILDPNNSLSEYIMIVTVIVHNYLCLTRSNNKWMYVANLRYIH